MYSQTQARFGRLPVSEEYSAEEDSEDEEDVCEVSLSFIYVLVCFLVVLANLLLLFFLSDVGPSLGFMWYAFAAKKSTDTIGLALLTLAFSLFFLFYVLDWVSWPTMGKGLSGFLMCAIAFVGLGFMATLIPGSTVVLGALLIPFLILVARNIMVQHCPDHEKADPSTFYRVAGGATLVCAALLLITWLVWILAGDHMWWSTGYENSLLERSEVQALMSAIYSRFHLNPPSDLDCRQEAASANEAEFDACEMTSTFLFLPWVYPFVAFIINLLIAGLVFRIGHYTRLKHAEGSVKTQTGYYELAFFCGLLAALLIGIHAADYIGGANRVFSKVLMFAFFVGVVVVFGWLYMEFQTWGDVGAGVEKQVEMAIEKYRVREKLASFTASDWVKAFFVALLGPAIPIYLLMVQFRDEYRKCMDDDEHPPYFQIVRSKLATWDWASVLYKFCLLGDVYFIMAVGFSKVTYIFLSWFNDFLGRNLAFQWILLAALIVAVLLFVLLPPLPGVAVYLFCGLLVLAQVKNIESISFAAGCAIATALAFFSKVLGSSLQYAIGFCLGGNVSIQQQIGVDKVFIRAMEVILNRPGLNPGKVFILVGGPDWPTSVLCGILRVSLCQMIIGTFPILFVMFPTVMAGAFKTLVEPGEKCMYSNLSDFCMVVTAVVQPVSTMLATQATFRVMSEQGEELAKSRPAHKAVEQLSAVQARRDEVYKKTTQWTTMACSRKVLILIASLTMYISGFLFFFCGSWLCFETFSVSSKIEDPISKNGLDGDPLKIVKVPVGWFALGSYFVSVVFQITFRCVTNSDAREDPEHPDYEESDYEE